MKTKTPITLSTILLVLILLPTLAAAAAYHGRIVDAATKHPLAGAFVTLQDTVVQTDDSGTFHIVGEGERIGVRAYGHAREWIDLRQPRDGTQEVALAPLTPKALYLSVYGIGNSRLRQAALNLIEATELNALTIDVKGDRGLIAYPSAIPLAARVGAQNIITIKNLSDLITTLRAKGIYTIARIVTFKDNPLALARPDLAVKTQNGDIWRDRERLAWTDPFKQEVRDYNIAVAVEAAKSGFDEIQFDYLRFPDARGLVFSRSNTQKNRVTAIAEFLQEAKTKLRPYNVFLAADIFGYVCWNLDDTDIGQKLEELTPYLDFTSAMLYPSGYHLGIPGYRNPVAHPYEIVYLSLKKAKERTGLPPTRFRPWLQAFKDYAFDRRPFTGTEIRAQIQAAEDFGSNGWMLWNPRNVYSADGLSSEDGWRQE
jgi:hypothetical protein